MGRPIKLIIFLVVILVAVIGGALVYIFAVPGSVTEAPSNTATNTPQTLTSDELAASSTVAAFGKAEQQVSLLAPDAATTIASIYGSYVAPSLLAQWEANPQSAPGRVTSSPWPDHIIVGSITPNTNGYEVQGTLVLMTSDSVEHGGYDEEDPIVIDLVNQNGAWLIESYHDLSGQ